MVVFDIPNVIAHVALETGEREKGAPEQGMNVQQRSTPTTDRTGSHRTDSHRADSHRTSSYRTPDLDGVGVKPLREARKGPSTLQRKEVNRVTSWGKKR